MRPPRPLLIALSVVASAALAACGPEGDRAAPADRARVTLLGTTDVHGYLLPWTYAEARSTDSSLVQLAALVDSVRRVDTRVVLLDSGDFLQGSELTDHVATTGIEGVHPVVAAMNAMDYDAAALGNHEFNHGIDFLERALDDGKFPFLSANTYLAGTDSLAFPPYTIVERDGVRIGILGLTTPGIAVWDRDHVEGRLEFRDMITSGRRWLEAMREHEPDVVVVAAHSGIEPGSTYGEDHTGVMQEAAVAELVREVQGVDVVFAGHTAGPEAPREIEGTLVVHAGHWGETLAAVHVTLERGNGGGEDGGEDDAGAESGDDGDAGDGWVVVDRSGVLLDAADAVPDPELVALVQPAHEATRAWLDEELAMTTERWSGAESRVLDTPIADLVTGAMREAVGADLAGTAIFDPSVSFGPGPVTRRDVLALYRYPNRLKSVAITGRELAEYLEWSARYYERFPAEDLVSDSVIAFNYDVVSGLEYRIDLGEPAGRRVGRLRHRGADVGERDTLSMAVNSYRQAGGGGFRMLVDLPVLRTDDRLVSEIVVDFIRRRDTLRAEDVHRVNWRLEPEAAVEQLLETGATVPRF